MAAFMRCVLLCSLLACVLGHAVLRDPTPLNTNPTTAQPCGAAIPTNAVPAVTWKAGSTVNIQFQLVASDGGNTATGYVDRNGGTNFDTSNPLFTGAMDAGLKVYSYDFTVPSSLVCNPICTFRVATNTNWNSCSMVNVTCPNCPAPPPPPPVCKQSAGLTFCAAYYDKTNVVVPTDSTQITLETNAHNAYNAYINNTNVFYYGNSTACQKTFQEFICKQNIVPCPGSGETISSLANCDETCTNLNKVCGLNPIHANLYDCKTFPKCLGESSAPLLSSSLLFSFALLALLVMM